MIAILAIGLAFFMVLSSLLFLALALTIVQKNRILGEAVTAKTELMQIQQLAMDRNLQDVLRFRQFIRQHPRIGSA